MKYRYETHLHTKEASACASASGLEMAQAHKALGYTGIFVTDHFFNGNCAVPAELPWTERVNLFCSGYENAKEEGDRIGLQVFFGYEFNSEGAEFLIYNLDKQWLLAHENIDRMDTRKALALMREDGAFIIQAHPFRERDYLDHIHLYPRDVDGVEAVNAANRPEENIRALQYARMYQLPVTAGSDSHHTDKLYGGGIETEIPINNPLDYMRIIRLGMLEMLKE